MTRCSTMALFSDSMNVTVMARYPIALFREVRLNRREDTVLWGKDIFDWTKPAVTEHLENGGPPYRLATCGDVSIPDLSLLLAFDESDRLEYVEMWAAYVRPEHIVGPERRQFVSHVARFFQRLF